MNEDLKKFEEFLKKQGYKASKSSPLVRGGKLFLKYIKQTKADYPSKEKTEKSEDYSDYILDLRVLPEYVDYENEMEYVETAMEVSPVLIKGPAGIGKSLLARTIGAKKQIPVFTVNCHNYTRASSILGKWVLINGTTKWVDGPVVKAVKAANKHGKALLIVEELNAMKPGVSIALHSLLDFRKELVLDEKDGEVIRLKEGAKLYVIGTMNPGYEGTFILNPAFKERFVEVELDYPTESEEREIIMKITRVNEEIAEKISKIAAIFREAYKRNEIVREPSPRESVKCAEVYKVCDDLRKAVQYTMVNKCCDTKEEKELCDELIKTKVGII